MLIEFPTDPLSYYSTIYEQSKTRLMLQQNINLLQIYCAPTVLFFFPPHPSFLHSLFHRVMFRHPWRLSLSRQGKKDGMWRAEGERRVWQQSTCMPCGTQLSGERCSASQNSTAALRYFTSWKCIVQWSALVLSICLISSVKFVEYLFSVLYTILHEGLD